ncbi:MAG: Transcriptional regulator marR/emrR family [Microvirga sp.]|jgi:DNA-binding MarR family transcriptional regulator|uniref:MarR family transcriptional regulator n=1 Tax=Microvirga brassicacearum TaxID=2580413 RepID=A0A5N3P5L0_9HYPH|nr:MarR family transcriptional regulator [Microvirga brassicacearum]KAB0265018.1 MarR family transcriptional regulator [Microvirga brassicacearum]MDF2811664.1 Transcriptional regulator marR/emrR family [Microvirga sp.]
MSDRPVRRKPGQPTASQANSLVGAVLTLDVIRFGYRIGYLAQLFTGPLYRELSERHDIGRQEWVVLFCSAYFEKLTAQEIGQMSGRAKANVSRAVNKLVRMGLLKREPNLADARSTQISLTRKGRAVFDQTLKPFVEREAEMLSVLTVDEVSQLDILLAKLTNRADRWDAPY